MKKLLAASTMALAVGVSGPALAEPIKIGVITTLSGGGAGLGIDVRDAILLAVEHSGNDEIELIIEDDAQEPETAVQIADRMIQNEQVDILTGIIWSNLAMAVVPSAVQQDVIYISANAGPSALAGANCHPNYFNAAYQNDNLHEAMGSYANQDYSNMFIMAPNYPAGTDSLTGFKRFYEGELADEIYTQIGQTDYASEISQIRASGADGVFAFLPGGMGISFMRQYSQSDIDIPVMGPGFSFDQDVLDAIGDSAIGVMNSSHWSPDMESEANQEFMEAFQEAYDRLPSLYAVQGWDAANLVISAASKASIDDLDAFRAALKEADIESPRGEWTFNTNNHPIQDIYVREVVERDGVLTNQLVATAFEAHEDAYASECQMD